LLGELVDGRPLDDLVAGAAHMLVGGDVRGRAVDVRETLLQVGVDG